MPRTKKTKKGRKKTGDKMARNTVSINTAGNKGTLKEKQAMKILNDINDETGRPVKSELLDIVILYGPAYLKAETAKRKQAS